MKENNSTEGVSMEKVRTSYPLKMILAYEFTAFISDWYDILAAFHRHLPNLLQPATFVNIETETHQDGCLEII